VTIGPLAIETHGLGRTFYPHQRLLSRGSPEVAVEDVNLQVSAGTIFGLLGPNGAGKTTTIKMLSTLLIPSRGTATVAGFNVVSHEQEVRKRLGVLLGGDRGLYGKISAVDNLRFFATLYGVPRDRVEPRVQGLLEQTGLSHRQGERVEGFSRGMKQRLHLAKALIHDPDVVILDEPTIGLDPDAAVQLRSVVKSLVPEKTVLLTTHYLQEADELCERIAIIDGGRIIVEDTPQGIKQVVESGSSIHIAVIGAPCQETIEALRSCSGVEAVRTSSTGSDGTTVVEVTGVPDSLTRWTVPILIADGHQILEVRHQDVTLEQAFLSLTGAGQHGMSGTAR
jgi:ABC-2 type transport system ATP-binding protein